MGLFRETIRDISFFFFFGESLYGWHVTYYLHGRVDVRIGDDARGWTICRLVVTDRSGFYHALLWYGDCTVVVVRGTSSDSPNLFRSRLIAWSWTCYAFSAIDETKTFN